MTKRKRGEIETDMAASSSSSSEVPRGIVNLDAAAADNVMVELAEELTHDDLQLFTDNFTRKKLLGFTQFGVLHRGTIPQGYWKGRHYNQDVEKSVIVKIWKPRCINTSGKYLEVTPEYLLDRVKDEIRFLSLPSLQNNPFVPKVLGYCFGDETLGVVYDVNPLNTVHNIIHRKDKFGWRNRVKVALGLARFLSFCHGHTPKYLVRNLSAAHVIVDKDFNPVLVDFAMIYGGGMGDKRKPAAYLPVSSFGYFDGCIYNYGFWAEKTDVYTFGVVLVEFIQMLTSRRLAKLFKVKHYVSVAACAIEYYEIILAEKGGNTEKVALVNGVLWGDPDFDVDDGIKISRLAMDCLLGNRPTMLEIVHRLEKMNVTMKHACN